HIPTTSSTLTKHSHPILAPTPSPLPYTHPPTPIRFLPINVAALTLSQWSSMTHLIHLHPIPPIPLRIANPPVPQGQTKKSNHPIQLAGPNSRIAKNRIL